MPLQAHILPWAGFAVRHIPDTPGKSYDIYDFGYCSRSNENRWNIAGESTLYLAKEKNVALAEYARHFKVDRTPELAAQTYRRQVFRFKVELDRVLDLRNAKVWAELSLETAPDCFKDKNIARSTANFIRNTTSTQAIIVPSIAFLDNLEQWCLVLFLEKLPPDSREFLPTVEPDDSFKFLDLDIALLFVSQTLTIGAQLIAPLQVSQLIAPLQVSQLIEDYYRKTYRFLGHRCYNWIDGVPLGNLRKEKTLWVRSDNLSA